MAKKTQNTFSLKTTSSVRPSCGSTGRRRKATETSGLLPTPRANKITPQSRADFTPNLAYEVETALLPTPSSTDYMPNQPAREKLFMRGNRICKKIPRGDVR